MLQKGLRLNGSVIGVVIAGLLVIVLVMAVARHFYNVNKDEPSLLAQSYPRTAPLGQLPEGARPVRSSLDLKIIPDEEYFSGTATIEIQLDITTDFIWLHGRGLSVSRVFLRKANGNEIEATYEEVGEEGVAKISFAKEIKPGTVMLQIDYEARFNENPVGLYKVENDGRPIVFSHFMSIEARRAFPLFDEPRFKIPFDLSVIAPEDDVVVTNAPEAMAMPVDDGLTLHLFDTTRPLPPAVVSFTVGKLEVIGGGDVSASALRERKIPLRGISVPGRGGDMSAMLEATQPMLEALETYFGQPYPYAKLDLVAVPNLDRVGMENAAAPHYREDHVFVGKKTSAEKLANIAEAHAHEISHQWFGNLVTPFWWDDLWLNEGLAFWIGGKIVHQWDGSLGADDNIKRNAHRVMKRDGLPSARQIYQQIEDNDDILSSYSDIASFKGGGILEMFEAYAGEDNFREGIAMHMKRHAGKTANLDEFIEAISVGSRHPEIAEAFRRYVKQAGLPVVEAALDCTGDKKELNLIQSRYFSLGTPAQDETFWHIPVCYRTDKGRSCHFMTEKSETVHLEGTCPAYVMPNADASGYYVWALGDVELENLVASLSKLSDIETQSVAYNLGHWFRSGRVDPEQFFNIVKALKALDRNRVDSILVTVLREALLYAPGDEAKTTMKQEINHLFEDKAKALGFNPRKGEGPGRSILRDDLVGFLLFETGEGGTRNRFRAVVARARIDFGKGLAHRSRINTHAKAAMIYKFGALYANAEFSQAMIDALLTGAKNVDDHVYVDALVLTQNVKVYERALTKLVLSKSLESDLRIRLVEGLARNQSHKGRFWAWLGKGQNFKALIALTADGSIQLIVDYGSHICDEETKVVFEQVVGEHLGDFSEGVASYAQSLEAINQCLAIRQTQGPTLAAAFK
jgi:aminopeptidase N